MTRPWDRIERTTKVRVCAHRSARVGRLACSKMAIFWARLQGGVKSAQREKCTLKEVKKTSTYGLGTQAHSRACLVLSARLSLSFLVSSHHLLLGHALLLLGPFDAPQLPVSTTRLKNDHVSPPTPTHRYTLNQSLNVRPRYTQDRSFQPMGWVTCLLWPENSPVTCSSQTARSRRDTRARREGNADKHLLPCSDTYRTRHVVDG